MVRSLSTTLSPAAATACRCPLSECAATCTSRRVTDKWASREFWGRTIYHNMYVTYGPNGRIAYSAYAPENPRRPLLRYARSGEMGSAASLKTGIYRKVVPSMTAATGYVGQLSAVRTG